MIDHYLDEVRRAYPDLAITDAVLNDVGQNNDVLVVNESLIFRFSKHTEASETLRTELALLKAIRGRLPIDIPNPTFTNIEDGRAAVPFVGYEMIDGVPLSLDTFASIDDEHVLDAIGKQLGAFLRELHSIDTRELAALNLAPGDEPSQWSELYERIQQRLFTHMSAEGRRAITAHFQPFLSDQAGYSFTPALRHGDFGTSNIIFEPAAGRIAGIIDFGNAGLGDPAVDVGGLLRFGEPFLARCSRSYPEMDDLLGRVRFYQGTFALQEALYGLEHDDAEAFEAGIAGYR